MSRPAREGRMEALLGRMEGLLARLEEVEGRLLVGRPPEAASAASVHYHIVSKEQMEADQKAIQEFIQRERHEAGEGPPIAD